jgi:hypothetical protein
MTKKSLAKRAIFLSLLMFLVMISAGCTGNTSPGTNETMEKTNATIDNSQQIQNLSFYLNDSQSFEGSTIYMKTKTDALIKRFYVVDYEWVGEDQYGDPSIAFTFRDNGENVTKVFQMAEMGLNQIDLQKGQVVEIGIITPDYARLATCTIIEYDQNGTNPSYRPYV